MEQVQLDVIRLFALNRVESVWREEMIEFCMRREGVSLAMVEEMLHVLCQLGVISLNMSGEFFFYHWEQHHGIEEIEEKRFLILLEEFL